MTLTLTHLVKIFPWFQGLCVLWWFIPSQDDLNLDSPRGDFPTIPGPLCFVEVPLSVFDEGTDSYHHQMTLTLTHLVKIFPWFQGLWVLWFLYPCLLQKKAHTIARWPWPWLNLWRFSHKSRASVFRRGSVICVWCKDRFILWLDDLDSPHEDFPMIPGPLCYVVVPLSVFDAGTGSYQHQMTLTLTHLMKIFPWFQGLCVLWWFIPSPDDLDLDSPHEDFPMIPGPLCFVVVPLSVFGAGTGSYYR